MKVKRDGADGAGGGNVRSVIDILAFLASTSQPAGVNAIARALAIPPSSCFRILKQLRAAEFVEFNEETKCYSLGSGAVSLARRALDPHNAFKILRQRLDQFVECHGVAVGFWRRLPRGRMVLAGFVESHSPMHIQMTLGQRLPMLVGAVGRAFAAELGIPENELKAEFERLRWQQPPRFQEYWTQISECQRRGYAVDTDNFAYGVTTVAVVLRETQTEPRYGLSAIMFSGPQSKLKVAEVGEALVQLVGWASPRIH